MKLEITKEWLAQKLDYADDTNVSVSGMSLDELKKDVQKRTVSPSVLESAPNSLGKVVKYRREQKGWSRQTLADIASIEVSEIISIETLDAFSPSPRAVVYLADALGFSKAGFKELVGYVTKKTSIQSSNNLLKFAASSANISHITEEEFETIRSIVETLLEQK